MRKPKLYISFCNNVVINTGSFEAYDDMIKQVVAGIVDIWSRVIWKNETIMDLHASGV